VLLNFCLCCFVVMWEDLGDSDSSESGDGEDMDEGEGSSSHQNGSARNTKNEEKVVDKVYLPSGDVESDTELEFEPSAYRMYHSMEVGAPCLSFDVLKDSLGDNRTDYPVTMYLVAGTQLTHPAMNTVILLKMSGMGQMKQNEESDEDSESDDDLYDDEEPQLDYISISHQGGVNRIRVAPLLPEKRLVAAWSDRGVVNIWDITKHAVSMDIPGRQKGGQPLNDKPLYSFSGHQTEGFAIDWSPLVPGRLATGDCKKNIHLWTPQEGGSWHVNQQPFSGHTHSVEDIQWSRNEETVFASCSVDKTIRIWDTRAAPSKACMLTTVAHDSDVNVISWNKTDPVIVSGGDDGVIKMWDLREFQNGSTLAVFKHHTAPITSVEWHPTDSTVFASSGEDDQVVQWDLAVEKDTRAEQEQEQKQQQPEGESSNTDPNVPPQLLFIHQGQKEVKELHWHPQIPGVLMSTAASGFNIFRTISV
jgi:ribosome assembly protein RRB1